MPEVQEHPAIEEAILQKADQLHALVAASVPDPHKRHELLLRMWSVLDATFGGSPFAQRVFLETIALARKDKTAL